MSHMNYDALINLGRKAGLNTAELYRALSTRRPDSASGDSRHSDCNGFTGGYSEEGKVEYRPIDPRQ